MLHAPTSETKTATMRSKSQFAPQPDWELHPHAFGAGGAYALNGTGNVASVRSSQAQQRQNLAGMQSTHGNQAVLRMMQSSPKVARMPALRPSQGMILQRKCACGGSSESTGECAECQAKREAGLQRRVATQGTSPAPTTAPPIVHNVLSSPGQPLDTGTRAFMEPRFGHDFSQVRVHTDSRAAESARAVNALAYTVGRNVVFGTGQYAPGTSEGRRLMAHELTHTLQQSNIEAGCTEDLRIGEVDTQFESEADETASHISSTMNSAVSNSSASVLRRSLISSPVVQRRCDQPESFYQNSEQFCLDTTFSPSTHPGKNCYRETSAGIFGCPPGDHCCFAPDGSVEDSHDRTSLADDKKKDGTCSWEWACVVEHTLTDYLPAVLGLDCLNACINVPGPKDLCMQSCLSQQ